MSRGTTYITLFLVMIVWGFNVVAVKYLVDHFPPVAMQGGRILIAAVSALIVLWFLKDLRKLRLSEWGWIACAALFGQLGHHSLLAIGLTGTTASNASLILGLIPVTTALLAILFLNDRLTKLRGIGIAAGFAGVAVVVTQNGDTAYMARGDFLVFLSMISQAVSFIFIKKISGSVSPRQLTGVMLLIGSLMLLGLSFLLENPGSEAVTGHSGLVWLVFFSSAVLATGLGHILYNAAIHRIGAGQTAIFNNLVPFFALVGAFFLLGETILLTQIAGFVLIVTGVILGTGYADMKIRQRKKTGKPYQA
ncbi:DMT family transporter [Alteribacter natronophilus]|uniref:DMT family transporter n=1 Tax=Alteribacter natronophilus TaxID=2583810 RepID=UPI00110EA8A3|nr:DMT family transporter [Alteribacter natronophilus]TMW73433.1 DMT family transporter [Alteribacter natronophilus]